MVDLKVMAYFKISLSTRNWDRAFYFDSNESFVRVHDLIAAKIDDVARTFE